MIAAFSLNLALVGLGVVAPGPCDLLTREAAGQLLGQALPTASPSGPEPDEDTSGTRTVCVYQAGTRMLIVIRVSFESADDAREAATEEIVSERLRAEGFTIQAEPNLGERAFWAQNPGGASEIIALKGTSVLGVALGGMPKEPSAYHPQLRATMVAVLAALH